MKKYSAYNFNQAIINEIKQSGSKWSLDSRDFNKFLEALPNLIQNFDLSEIITNVDYPNPNNIPVFNAVGTYAQLAKWTENALRDEEQGKNADYQWKTVKAVLEHALTLNCIHKEIDNTQIKGEEFCSLIRGWENDKGAAQGDQILKLLEKNLQATKNHEIKSAIFDLILEEANKGEEGLYAIPNSYKTNQNVKYAAAKHQEFVDSDELLVLGARWNNMEVTEESNISYNDGFVPVEMLKELDLNDTDSKHWNSLFKTLSDHANALAEKATSTPENYETWINNATSILSNALSDQQPSTSVSAASSSKTEFNFKENINKINELIKNYKIVISNEYINNVLETKNEEIINQALNKPDLIKKELLAIVENFAKSLSSHYASLNVISKSLFLESNEFQNLAKLIEDLLPISYHESKALKYEYCKIIKENVSNPFQQLGSAGGDSLAPLEEMSETYIKWYEQKFLGNANTNISPSNLDNNVKVEPLGIVDLDLD